MSKYKFCTISILKSTRDNLKDLKFTGESYDDVIIDILKTPNGQYRKMRNKK